MSEMHERRVATTCYILVYWRHWCFSERRHKVSLDLGVCCSSESCRWLIPACFWDLVLRRQIPSVTNNSQACHEDCVGVCIIVHRPILDCSSVTEHSLDCCLVELADVCCWHGLILQHSQLPGVLTFCLISSGDVLHTFIYWACGWRLVIFCQESVHCLQDAFDVETGLSQV